MDRELNVAVIGAGPSGLAAAQRLQDAGARVTVFEAAPTVGGRTRSEAVDGCVVDTGAQLFASMFVRMRALVRELGLGDRLVRSPGRDALWRGGRAHEVTYGSVASMLTSGGLSLGAKLRLGAVYLPFLTRHADALDMHAPELAARAGLDAESIAEWGRRSLGEEFVESLAYPQLAAYYGVSPEETSAGLFHILAQHGTDVTVFALRGGAGVLAETLAARVAARGGEVRLSTPVERVGCHGSTVRVAAGTDEAFDGAVLAVPAPVALRLLGPGDGPLATLLREVRVRPALTAALLLDRPAGVRYFGLSFPRSEARTVSAVCVEENKGAGLVPEGRGLLLVFARPDVAPALVEAPARDVVDALLPDVERAFPRVRSHVVRARVYRWPEGNPVFYPGYLQRLARFRERAAEATAPLALAGDYLYSTSVEGAVTAGQEAAARLLRLTRHARE